MTRSIYGLGSSIAAAILLSSGMSLNRHPIMEDADEVRPRPAERFKPTPAAEAERIRKAQEKRARKAAKLRSQS